MVELKLLLEGIITRLDKVYVYIKGTFIRYDTTFRFIFPIQSIGLVNLSVKHMIIRVRYDDHGYRGDKTADYYRVKVNSEGDLVAYFLCLDIKNAYWPMPDHIQTDIKAYLDNYVAEKVLLSGKKN